MTTPPKIGHVHALAIDDSRFDRRRLERMCDESDLEITLIQTADKEQFGIKLDADKYDVIFVDMHLADGNGLDLIPVVRGHRINGDAAIIMIASDSHADVALNAIRSGCSDYIDKDTLNVAALSRATINAIQKLYLQRSENTARQGHDTIHGVLQDFADECRDEMRPMVTRILRQIRRLRTTSVSAEEYADIIVGLEKTCVRMDEFLGDLSSVAGMQLAPHPTAGPVAPAPKPQATPPTIVAAAQAPQQPAQVRPRRAALFSHK